MDANRASVSGLARQLQDVVGRLTGRALDWRFGIHTRGYFRPQELGNPDPDAKEYVPTSYVKAWRLLRRARFAPHQDAFVDYGCGMGRVLVLASRYRYAEVIGVEFSAALCQQAEQNLAAAKNRQRCGSAKVVNADAREFQLPDHATVIFLYNPFRGETLCKVVSNIALSVERRPRSVQLLVCNCSELIEMTGSQNWLTRTYFGHSDTHSLAVFQSK
jgi:SAM-dependent methyltransferase